MKIIVIYKSKSGYTKTYAKWISEDLNCDIKDAKDITISELEGYDVIIYGGGLYATGINGISILKKNYHLLKNKKLIVWATGANHGRESDLQKVWHHNFTDEQLKNIKTFYLRGGFDYTKLNTVDKILMNVMKLILKSKKVRTKDEQELLHAYHIPEYHCNKEKTKDLISYINSLAK